jgi:iron(III) transport system ATP-binding protein
MNVSIKKPALSTAAKAISISDVNLYYGALHVLKDINLEIKPGEFFAFLGPSGCGKTTLLRLIAGFNTARNGKVVIGGEDVLNMPPWKREVGMVFQSYALWPHMTVARNVAFGLEERRLPRAEIDARVKSALELVGLEKLADRRPVASSSAWLWRAPSRSNRRFCCSTSRSPISTPRCASKCAANCANCSNACS